MQGVNLTDYGLQAADLRELKRIFQHATTFGSLIQVPEGMAVKLPALTNLVEATSQDLFVAEALSQIEPLVKQAVWLAAQYDAVIANPPYLGGKWLNNDLKVFLKAHYSDFKTDLFSAFINQCSKLGSHSARIGLMNPNVWMFISSHEKLRKFITTQRTLTSLVELPLAGFRGATVQICSYNFLNNHIARFKADFIQLTEFKGGDEEMSYCTRQAIKNYDCGWRYTTTPDDFTKIPGRPIAYWVSEKIREVFFNSKPLGEHLDVRQGMATTDNNRFLRFWHEIEIKNICFNCDAAITGNRSGKNWFPYNKGGEYRKWYGNNNYVVLYERNGQILIDMVVEKYPRISDPEFVIKNRKYYFKPSVTWSFISSSYFGARYSDAGFIFDVGGSSGFVDDPALRLAYAGLLCSNTTYVFLRTLNPTLNFQVENIQALPHPPKIWQEMCSIAVQAIEVEREDWNAYERSWDFQSLPALKAHAGPLSTIASSFSAWIMQNRNTIAEMKRLEEENNRLFIDAYGLQDVLTAEVSIEQITLTLNPAYRYGKKLSDDEWSVERGFPLELETRFREDTMQELISYAIGCAMGRYNLDEPGLIYADSGNVGFDPNRYRTFPADDDGIIPITEMDWFDDDATHRLVEFISVAWDSSHLEENLAFLAANLSPKKGETSRDTLRRYLADRFFKDHLQTYKRRPIYWCVSSGKLKAFQCLVYLHRYHPGTLARMRMEYVVPLQSKMAARIDSLADDIQAATSSAQAKRLQKERDTLTKQLEELRRFDEQLRHYADQRIALDLDDGVKVNYGKFGDLLAEVKAVTGTSAD